MIFKLLFIIIISFNLHAMELPCNTQNQPQTNLLSERNRIFLRSPGELHYLKKPQLFYGIATIGMDLAQHTTLKGAKNLIKLGVIDSNFDCSNSHISAQNFCYTLPFNDGNLDEDQGHGTHVLGTICGNGKFGAATNCKISLWLALGNPNTDLTATPEQNKIKVALYLSNVFTFFAKNGVRLISRSMGSKDEGGFDRKNHIETMLKFASEQNGLIVHAAGNENRRISNIPAYADEHQGILLIANVNSLGLREETSNYGPPIFIAAPGTDIFSIDAYKKYDEEHQKKIIEYKGIKLVKQTGTSMATPHVSGTITAMLNIHPELSNHEIIKILRLTAIKKIGRQRSEAYGYGILNAYAAIKVVRHLRDGMSIEESLEILKKKSTTFYEKAINILEQGTINHGSITLKTVQKLLRKAYFSDSENLVRKEALYLFQKNFGIESEAYSLAIDLFYLTQNLAYIADFTKENKMQLKNDLELNHKLTGTYEKLLYRLKKDIEEIENEWLENMKIKCNELKNHTYDIPVNLFDNLTGLNLW